MGKLHNLLNTLNNRRAHYSPLWAFLLFVISSQICLAKENYAVSISQDTLTINGVYNTHILVFIQKNHKKFIENSEDTFNQLELIANLTDTPIHFILLKKGIHPFEKRKVLRTFKNTLDKISNHRFQKINQKLIFGYLDWNRKTEKAFKNNLPKRINHPHIFIYKHKQVIDSFSMTELDSSTKWIKRISSERVN